MRGRIIKGIAGFYYVYIGGIGILECKARGILRKKGMKPLVGDWAEVSLLSFEDKKGSIEDILDRKNKLVRPAVANIDQALVVFALKNPEPDFPLLDRFLVMMRQKGLSCILVFNKEDLAGDGFSVKEGREALAAAYGNCGCELFFASAREKWGLDEIRRRLQGKATAVAGPSGVGKSSLINLFQREIAMETGELSEKIGRGKHVTRHSQLIVLDRESFILDTPGFSSLELFSLEKEELEGFYPDFSPYRYGCRFVGCSHTHEPDCGVKEACALGQVNRLRYENYRQLYGELLGRRRH